MDLLPISDIKALARRVIPPRAWAQLRRLRHWYDVNRFRHRVVRHRYGRSTFTVDIADPLAAGWYDLDWKPLKEIELLAKHKLKPGARVFDCGAHQSVVAMMIADVVGPTGRVVAIEANAENARQSRINRDLNAMSQLEVVHAAVAETDGRIAISIGNNAQVDDGSGTAGQVMVDAVCIDSLTQRFGQPDVLFIDIEGFEYSALRGGAKTLAQRPDVFIEMHVGCGLERFGGSVDKIAALFPAESYTLYMAGEEDLAFVPFDPSSATVRDRFFLIAIAN